MNQHKITLSLVAALALSGPVLSATKAIASPSKVPPSEQLIAQRFRNSQTINGRVRCITGDVVGVKLDNGEFKMVTLSVQTLGSLGIIPGTRVSATLEDERIVAVNREVIEVQTIASSNLLQRVRQFRSEIESRSASQFEVRQQPARIPTQVPRQQVPRQQFTTPSSRPVAPAAPIRGLW